MAKYQLLEKAFIDNRLWEPGEVAEVPDDFIPGPHMLPEDHAAKKMAKEIGLVNGPLPDPVDQITSDVTNFGAAPQTIKAGMTAQEL